MRALARTWPEDTAVREQLATGLFNTLNDAKDEGDTGRRDALLEELRALARTSGRVRINAKTGHSAEWYESARGAREDAPFRTL